MIKGRRAVWLYLLISVVAAAVFSLCTWRFFLDRAGRYLVLDQGPAACEAIVSVSGDDQRRFWAIELYRRGFSRRLIFNVSDTTYVFGRAIDPAAEVLEMATAAGIPRDSIFINPDIGSTWEDALATRRLVERLGLHSILVVSSPFNMRRVYLTYRHRLADLPLEMRFSAVPPEKYKLSLDSWWSRERELQLVFNEYLKIIFYYFKYFS